MEAHYCKYVLDFKNPSGTSRGILTTKESYFIIIRERERIGVGECGLLKGLSIDDVDDYEDILSEVCEQISLGFNALKERYYRYPSIQFGLEQAFRSLDARDPFLLFPSSFTGGHSSIPINGLIWIGDEDFLYEQLEQKIASGFQCIKMKVGALDFDTELRFIKTLRQRYSTNEVQLRLDANGAFQPAEALDKLKLLSQYEIHSIEQPVAQGQLKIMTDLCRKSPIPIALDEELIGLFTVDKKRELLERVRPHYIILKPSLVGGFSGSQEWIDLAMELKIGWWITSALESNIGLNAIAQWTSTLNTTMYQGLGTGGLYTNNFKSPLEIRQGMLYYDRGVEWSANLIHELCS
ncbi:MAG: o-succinylbenzoate synthase [Flavobacteriaceae bacterium]